MAAKQMFIAVDFQKGKIPEVLEARVKMERL
jgi:hypothetical protein